MRPNHYAANKPTVVLLDIEGQETQALIESGKPMVFSSLKKAQKHVQHRIEESMHKHIVFVNEDPTYGAGDREETNNRKCLKCKSFLRPSLKQTNSTLPDGTKLAVDHLDCPVCDLGESEQRL
jgi:hypothetical protein